MAPFRVTQTGHVTGLLSAVTMYYSQKIRPTAVYPVVGLIAMQ
jgi:hypothetical protein